MKMGFTQCILLCGLVIISTLGNPVKKSRTQLITEYAKLHPNPAPGVKDPEYGDLFDGDIMLKSPDDVPTDISPFNSIYDREGRWTDNKLYYQTADGQFTSDEKERIDAGVRELEANIRVDGELCVEMLPFVSHEETPNFVWVYSGGGCSSYLGMLGKNQTLSLAPGCVSRHGTIMHEFLHALGFHHEHKRADRDDWVTIVWENIEDGKEHNFDKLVENVTVDHLDTPYQYDSVMHYGNYAFAINDSIPTIVTHVPEAEIGQRTHMSDLDIERVQIFYDCLDPADSKFYQYADNTEWWEWMALIHNTK